MSPITMRKPASDTNELQRQGREHRPLRAVLITLWRIGSWCVCLMLLLASTAWMSPGSGWRVDLVANLTAQIGIVALALVVCFAVMRAWWRALPLVLALVFVTFALAPGRAGGGSSPPGVDNVRLLTFNSYNRDHIGKAAAEIVQSADVDVFTIIEPTPEILRLLNESDAFRERYPYTIPNRPYASRPTIVSRWPLEWVDFRYGAVPEGMSSMGISPTGGIIQRPEGAFVLVATHPPSPRSSEAWKSGNEGMRRLAARVGEVAEMHGLPIVVGGDFNSTPTGWRSRFFSAETGLVRGKPWLAAAGTWPSGLFWPAKLAIDDVFVSPSIGVVAWDAITRPHGGDHTPVLVDLQIPAGVSQRRTDDQPDPDEPAE